MALVVSGGKAATMPLHANVLPLSIKTKARVPSASAFPLFSPDPHIASRSLSIRLKLSTHVVSSVLSEDKATGFSGSGTDAFKLTYLEVGFLHMCRFRDLYYLSICVSISKCCIVYDYYMSSILWGSGQ